MSEGTNMYPNLNDQQPFRLNYFLSEIREKESLSKRLSKYIASFDYFDKSTIALYATSDTIFIASFATVIGAPIRIASARFKFSITTGIV